MWTRLKNTLSRSQLGEAYRFSRGIAGGLGGLFFTLGNIYKVPLQKFLSGYGPAGTTFSLSALAFFFKAEANYQTSHPDHISTTERLTTRLIIDKFHGDMEKTKDFLRKLKINEGDIRRIEEWKEEDEDDLKDVLNTVFNAIAFDIRKYPASFMLGLMTASSHYMECMLLQVYRDPDMLHFNVDKGFTAENIAISLITLMAVLHGIMEFMHVKSSFEHPGVTKLSHTIFRAYDKYQIPSPASAINTDEPDLIYVDGPPF